MNRESNGTLPNGVAAQPLKMQYTVTAFLGVAALALVAWAALETGSGRLLPLAGLLFVLPLLARAIWVVKVHPARRA